MLTFIEIENFKGVREKVRIPISPITLLFGANSTGKSTILHALLYAHEVLNHKNLDVDVSELSGKDINLGGFKNLIHGNNLNNELTLAFGLSFEDTDIPEFGSTDPTENISELVESACLRFVVKWNALDNRPFVSLYEVEINDLPAARLTAEAGRKEVMLHYNIKHPLVSQIWGDEPVDDYDQWPPIQIQNLSSVVPNWKEKLVYLERDDVYYLPGGDLITSQVLVGVGSVFSDYLSKMRYIGPIRSILPRNYAAIRTKNRQNWSDGSAAWDSMLSGSTGFVKTVGEWLERTDRLNSGYRIRLKQYKEVEIESPLAVTIQLRGAFDAPEELEAYYENLPIKRRLLLVSALTGREFSPHDVGVGISQIVPVLATSLLSSSEFVCIEQPELHIHPAMQTALGDLFASQVADRKCLFLIETHSEHLLLRLLRRIRETFNEELPPEAPCLTAESVSIVYVESDKGSVNLTPIRISRDGEFESRWPKGFFDERVEELF